MDYEFICSDVNDVNEFNPLEMTCSWLFLEGNIFT